MSQNQEKLSQQLQSNPQNRGEQKPSQQLDGSNSIQNQNQKRYSQHNGFNGYSLQKSDENQNKSHQLRNSNDDQPHKSSGQQSVEQNDEEQDRNSNIDDNKSEGEQQEEEDSNIKSDDKDEDQQRSGQDIKKEQPSGKKCFNKLCNSKKIYKKLRSKVEHAKYRFLCRQCYQNYCNNDFCEFCQQIYSSTGNTEDDDQWIGCDQCNRWNHIQCQKKYRNKNIHQIKDQDTPYLCLTCSFKAKANAGVQSKQRIKKQYNNEDNKLMKQKFQISKDQRVQIFNKKIQNLPSLQYFLQNYNFRLWINQNLIKDDLQTLREAGKKNAQQLKKNKKIKTQ